MDRNEWGKREVIMSKYIAHLGFAWIHYVSDVVLW